MNPISDTGPPRYSTRAFPPYRYIPGKAPHPIRDPGGHSYGHPIEQPETFDAVGWRSCDQYLYGIDLFNHGFWWEAHEALEAVWVGAGRKTDTGLFVQGLIQIAVAHLKRFQGFDDVARRMAAEGLDKIKRMRGIHLGIDVAAFRTAVEASFSGALEIPVVIGLVFDGSD
jgi:hypothetical protein